MTAPAGRSARAGSRADRRARRHSVLVRLFRFAIPLAATVAIGAVAVIAIFDPFGKMGGISLGPVSLSGTKITMEKPKLTGYKKDNRGYEMTATAALQDIKKPTIVSPIWRRSPASSTARRSISSSSRRSMSGPTTTRRPG
jgi:lipopolysaccharide export system protein LptC